MLNVRKKRERRGELDITPLMDVMFMLLLFFIVTSTFMKPAMEMKLPSAGSGTEQKEQSIVVSVNREGAIHINQEEVPEENFQAAMTSLLTEEKKKVHFQGDELMEYKRFVRIMDLLKKSGAEEIAIVHEAERK